MLGIIAIALAFATCSADINEKGSVRSVTTDSLFRSSVGDSIYFLLMKSKNVQAHLISSKDSVQREKVFRLNRTQREILRFILTDEENYRSDAVVYGRFLPTFHIVFKERKQICTLCYDFGLRKWGICDEKRNVYKQYDLPLGNMLRFARMLFPEDNLINELSKMQK